MFETKVNQKHRITIPVAICEKYNVQENDIVEWLETDDGDIEVRFRKKQAFEDLQGVLDLGYETNSVELEKELYK